MSGLVSASLADMPLGSLLESYGMAVSELSQNLTANYVTQLLALSQGTTSDGTFEDSEEIVPIRAVTFSASNAEGKSYRITIPVVSFMPPPLTVLHSNCDLTVVVIDVKDQSSEVPST